MLVLDLKDGVSDALNMGGDQSGGPGKKQGNYFLEPLRMSNNAFSSDLK